MKKNIADKLQTFALLSPWIVSFCAFWLYPLLYSAYLSLTKYSTLTNDATFIGFDNYSKIFSDPAFYQALKNTAIFTFGTVPVTTALALFFAVLLNSRSVRFKNFFRASFFMPSVTSLVVISLIFANLYSQQGYINTLLSVIGLPYPERGWLQEPSTALFAIMAMDVWISPGYYVILILAGLQTISNDLFDSAKLSGAGSWQIFRYVTLPMLRPTLLFVVVINTIKSFQIFVEIFVMTKGGPLGATTTLVYQIFVNAFGKADAMGYAAALAYVLFGMLLILSMIQMKILGSKK